MDKALWKKQGRWVLSEARLLYAEAKRARESEARLAKLLRTMIDECQGPSRGCAECPHCDDARRALEKAGVST